MRFDSSSRTARRNKPRRVTGISGRRAPNAFASGGAGQRLAVVTEVPDLGVIPAPTRRRSPAASGASRRRTQPRAAPSEGPRTPPRGATDQQSDEARGAPTTGAPRPQRPAASERDPEGDSSKESSRCLRARACRDNAISHGPSSGHISARAKRTAAAGRQPKRSSESAQGRTPRNFDQARTREARADRQVHNAPAFSRPERAGYSKRRRAQFPSADEPPRARTRTVAKHTLDPFRSTANAGTAPQRWTRSSGRRSDRRHAAACGPGHRTVAPPEGGVRRASLTRRAQLHLATRRPGLRHADGGH